MLDPPEEPTGGRPDDELGAVDDAIAGADQKGIGEWQAETDRRTADELATADADYAAGNTISGEELRHRYGLS